MGAGAGGAEMKILGMMILVGAIGKSAQIGLHT
jgi:NADH:ubiquinone oxidoreductase subunit 5 (subunit L)/multisubunit Na+/H+ antiporter MnhA subunit